VVKEVKFLGAQEILQAQDIKYQEVAAWGGTVRVRSLSGKERDDYERQCIEFKGKGKTDIKSNMRARLVCLAACDNSGKRLFTDDQMIMLGAKSAAELDKVFAVAQQLSGITDADVEELEKNSDATQGDDSPSN